MMLPRALSIGYLILFTLAFAVYAVAWPQAPVAVTDTAEYMRCARAISTGNISQFQFRAPGYPLLLLATGSTVAPSRLLYYVSLLLHFASVYLIAAVLYSVGIPTRLLNAFGVIMLLPPYVQITAVALSEALTAFCLALAFAMLYFYVMRKHRGFLMAASAALAYTAITRPTFEFLAVGLAAVLGLLVLALKPSWSTLKGVMRDATLLVSVSAVAVGGYSLFNYSKFGFFQMTPSLGYALATRTVSLYESIPDPKLRQVLVSARNAAYAQGQNPASAIFRVQARLMADTGESEAELGAHLQAMSLAVIRAHPEAYLEDVARGLVEFWFPYAVKLPLLEPARARILWYGVHFVVTGAFVLSLAFHTGLAVLWLATRRRCRLLHASTATAWLIAVLIVMYTAVISCAFAFVEARYRAPVNLLVLAAVGIGVGTARRIALIGRPVACGPEATDSDKAGP